MWFLKIQRDLFFLIYISTDAETRWNVSIGFTFWSDWASNRCSSQNQHCAKPQKNYSAYLSSISSHANRLTSSLEDKASDDRLLLTTWHSSASLFARTASSDSSFSPIVYSTISSCFVHKQEKVFHSRETNRCFSFPILN